MKLRGELYSDKYGTSNGRRTYFFNVKKNREGDLFLNLVESLRKFDDRFERQELVIYEEHIEKFRDIMNSVIDKLIELRDDKSQHSSYDSRDRRSRYDDNDSYNKNHYSRDNRRRDNHDDRGRDDQRRDSHDDRFHDDQRRDNRFHDDQRHDNRDQESNNKLSRDNSSENRDSNDE